MPINPRPLLFNGDAQPRRRQLSEERTKVLYEGPECDTYVLYFKDNLPLEGEKPPIVGKGPLNNRISSLLMSRINDLGIDTYLIRVLNMREQLVRKTEALPFSVTIHNVAFGVFAKRLGLEEGMALSKPIPEFFLRSQELGNPIVAAEHLTALDWCRFEEVDEILMAAQRINDFLSGQFLALNMRLTSFTLEFGRFYGYEDSQIMLTDELSPDTFELLDLRTGKRLGRQGIQDNPGQAQKIYQEVARRLIPSLNMPPVSPLSQDLSLLYKRVAKKSLAERKNPHGHNDA